MSEYYKYLKLDWDKDCEQVMVQSRLDSAYELGFLAAWNNRQSQLTAANALVDRLEAGINKIILGVYRGLNGSYQSPKNNKCKHDRFGFEDCGACVDEHLEVLLAEIQQFKHGNSHDKR